MMLASSKIITHGCLVLSLFSRIGHPDFDYVGAIVSEALQDPSDSSVVVIGHGNVALDCARILAKGSRGLLETDLASRALSVLGNGVSRVTIVGRRGHVQASFTIKEVRELGKLNEEGHDTLLIVHQEELDLGMTEDSKLVLEKSRPRSRISNLLHEFATPSHGTHTNTKTAQSISQNCRCNRLDGV
jgi:adrenodoxin-NADP+ reductase